MSVFQLQEWWATKITQDHEEFDLGCLCIGNADNAQPSTNKIMVGSQSGILRMYNPSKPGYRVEDLVLEETLSGPILQLLLGRFIPGSELLGLAVLHPRDLFVYEILPQAVKNDHASYYSLKKAYSHELGADGKHFTAFNMISGGFGGVRGRDMILVQALDGKLQIFEQSAHAFSRRLPSDFLFPGPIQYIPKIDAFVTVNPSGCAECYRYQVLASSNALVQEWSCNLGESCRQILLGSFLLNAEGMSFASSSNISTELLFVCERALFLVKAETGGIIQQRLFNRANISAATTVPYIAELSSGQTAPAANVLIAGQDGTVQVFAGFNLVWAATLNQLVPVHLAVGNFGTQRGLIVAIDENGQLSVNYLGTKPPVQTVLSQVRDLDYDQIDEEHRGLLQIIRDSQSENKQESQERLLMRCQIPKQFDLDGGNGNDRALVQSLNLPANLATFPANSVHAMVDAFVKMTVRMYLTYSGSEGATNVSLVVSCPPHIHVVPKNVSLDSVLGFKATPVVVKFTFFALKTALPNGLDVVITATYTSNKGESQVAAHYLELPLFLSVKLKPPTKSSPCKVILDTGEYPAVPLTELFSDVLNAYHDIVGMENINDFTGTNAPQAIAFQLHSMTLSLKEVSNQFNIAAATEDAYANAGYAPVISILVSKNAGRYRIQAESFPALYMVLAELERRLTQRLSDRPNSNLPVVSPTSRAKDNEPYNVLKHGLYIVRTADALPLEEYFEYVSLHLKLREILQEKNSQLNNEAQQYRVIQKRLLVRFRDKNPTPLHGLDTLLTESYQRILLYADSIEELNQKILSLQYEIECFSKLIATLMGMKFNLPFADRLALQSYLCPEIRDGIDQGWEETVTASLSFLLKTSLSSKGKNPKESLSLNTTSLEMPKTIDGFRKALLMVLDRLEKGGRIVQSTVAALPSTA